MLNGVLLDMDGVIFDSERVIVGIERETMEEMGHRLTPADQLKLAGLSHAAYMSALPAMVGGDFDIARFQQVVEAKRDHYYRNNEVPQKDGLLHLLEYLKNGGWSVAVASSSKREIIVQYLNQSGIINYFGGIVAGDMVSRSKPDPEIYQTAARLLGLATEQCAAVEDSWNGLRSANAAGCVTLMVPDLYPASDEARRLCAAVLPSLREVPEFLEAYNNAQPRQLAFGEEGS